MEVTAKVTNLRISARKLRLVADLLRGREVTAAMAGVRNLGKRGAVPLWKLLKQASANATHNFGLSAKNLRIERILVEAGPTYRRWRAVSRGQAHGIKKRTSHITLVLKGEKDGPKS